MSKKATILLSIFLGLTIIGLIIYFVFPQKENQLIVKTPSGTVSINDPHKLPSGKPLSMDGVNFKENTNYSIDYYPQDQGFIIAILNPNIQAARDAAEKDFLKTLDITKAAACKLKVTLSVPFDVNENASGKNYRLSFCPNGKAFPK
ncbi:MAG: hypothetical protein WA064_04875 [Candidatus Moraniibacteriota bacterium]